MSATGVAYGEMATVAGIEGTKAESAILISLRTAKLLFVSSMIAITIKRHNILRVQRGDL